MSNLRQRISRLEDKTASTQRPMLIYISERQTLPEAIKEYNAEHETNYKETDFDITMIDFYEKKL